MHMTQAVPGKAMPSLLLSTLEAGSIDLADKGWKLVVVYRGAHCPICKKYLTELERLRERYLDNGIEPIAISADQAERARPFIAETGFSGTVGVGLSIEQMKLLGVYISDPRSPEEAPAPFAEPAIFVTNADGGLQFVDKSNAPFVRPELEKVLEGIEFVRGNDYPIRGTRAA